MSLAEVAAAGDERGCSLNVHGVSFMVDQIPAMGL
jgi:hypothetical protein